mgnify:FL=1
MKYRKKPVVIEAIQFEDNSDCVSAISEMGLDPIRVSYKDPKRPVMKIQTLEGIMEAQPGDFIIRGVNGEFYPCKPDIFKKTYEPC